MITFFKIIIIVLDLLSIFFLHAKRLPYNFVVGLSIVLNSDFYELYLLDTIAKLCAAARICVEHSEIELLIFTPVAHQTRTFH